MTMHTYLPRTNAFDPEAILTMSIAFELACADLQVFEAVSIAADTQRSVAVDTLDVALPEIGGLENVPVGIYGSGIAKRMHWILHGRCESRANQKTGLTSIDRSTYRCTLPSRASDGR